MVHAARRVTRRLCVVSRALDAGHARAIELHFAKMADRAASTNQYSVCFREARTCEKRVLGNLCGAR